MPKVSVILTSYNHDKYIREAIESVLNQTFQDFELIIWDDGSVDDSWAIIQSYSDPRIQAISNPQNKGPVFGINKAIFEVARGKYIAIHHSDDVWELDKLAKQVAFLEANQEIGAVFSNAQPIDQRGVPLTDQTHFYYNIFSQPNRSRYEWLHYFFLTGNALCHPSLLIRKQCYLDCGAYRDMLAQMPDFDMWIRLCAKYEIHVMEDCLLRFRILDGEMNTSGDRPATRIRSANEYYKLLQQYRVIAGKEDIFKIFPDFISYNRGDDTDSEYVLARVCLESDDFFLRQLLAIEILFDILNDPVRRQAIEKVYSFSSNDFIAITGRSDLFSRQLQVTIIERDEQINSLTQSVFERDDQIATLQQWHSELSKEIEALRLSTSWKITKPLRDVSQCYQQIKQLIQLYQNHRWMYPGFSGFKRLIRECIDAMQKSGGKGLQNKAPLALLRTYLEKELILSPTIIFDHNGGGGSNSYSYGLMQSIHAEGGVVLRVYCFDTVWFVQWSGGNKDEMLFFTDSIEELFEVLSVSHSANIIINSLYGYPDIKVAATHIVNLVQTLKATLDFKIHDFYALCPSPHLSDFENKYCGVPEDLEVCKLCLKKNLSWYHSWYPKENRPTDIAEWRKPFVELFEIAATVTLFDSSSVDIVRKAFYLDDSKVKVVPHVIDYLICDKPVDITGSLHIGILGALSHVKGGSVVKMLCEHIDEQGLDIPITVVGSSFIDIPPKITVHGKYTPNDLPIIVSKRGINVILMPSIIPETFSYTISEAMAMGLPLVAFDIGAQGHRVKHYALGQVIPLGSSPAVILAAIQSVLKMAQEKK